MLLRIVWVSFAIAIAGGCFSSNATRCDDGTVCPDGRVCDAVHGSGCLLPAQLEACANLNDGAKCIAAGMTGRCDRGVCLPTCGDGVVEGNEECDCGTDPTALPAGCNGNNGAAGGLCSADCRLQVCGNGHVDPGEVCDDGNSIDGDGCGRACTSNEMCNNGITDAIKGEICDDGNFTSHDGCSSACVPEAPGWVQQLGTWTTRFFHTGAYHAGALQYVVFGGTTPQGRDSTTWLGSVGNNTRQWRTIPNPVPSPPPRQHAAMAYDKANAKMILFGGEGVLGLLGDTWELAGNPPTWRQVAPMPAPIARTGAAAAFDETRGRVVLFGGYGATGGLADTWEYNGATSTWSQVTTPLAPSARLFHAMAWEPGHIVMFGGVDSAPRNDTWLFDSATATWSQVMTPNTIAPRQWSALAYDPGRNKTILFGGYSEALGVLGDLWEFSAATGAWTQVTPAGPVPAARAGHTLGYDPTVQNVVLIGGADPTSARAFDDIWMLGNGGAAASPVVWTPRPSGLTPSVRAVPIAYDKPFHQLILFGGGSSANQADTWAFGGSPIGWHQLTVHVNNTPPARIAHAFAVDTSRDRIVMFGGYNEQQVWEWDGSPQGGFLEGKWTPVPFSCSPSCPGQRIWPSFAYDPKRNVFVMLGGAPDPNTWELTENGTTGVFTKGPIGPPLTVAERAPMAYDVASDRMVLLDNTGATWLYGQGAWVKAMPGMSPPPRASASFAYDPLRKHLVLVGGVAASVTLSDAWELHIDAPASAMPMVTWVPIGVSGTTPNGRSKAGFSWFPPLHGFIEFGGTVLLGIAQDTWLLQYSSSTPDDRCLMDDDDMDGKVGAADPDCQQ